VILHVAVAVSRCCRVRADSDCNTVVQLLCVRSGCAGRCCLRLWAGVQFRAAVVCYYCADKHVSVECSGVRRWGAVCLDVCVYVSL
jgi:hypothetical protein